MKDVGYTDCWLRFHFRMITGQQKVTTYAWIHIDVTHRDDLHMMMLVGVQFRRPATIKVDIGYCAVNDIANGSKQFLCTEVHVPLPQKGRAIQ